MDFKGLKLQTIGLEKDKFGKIYSFVDFGNVNYWFDKDQKDWEGNVLTDDQKLIVDIKKLSEFLDLFSEEKRFYYGLDRRMKKSWHIVIKAEKNGFKKITKPIQYIKHYLDDKESEKATSKIIKEDNYGKFIEIPKSNFDVEISIDSIRLIDKYDTFCLLSGDSDFSKLAEYLKKQDKKVIVIASGQVFHTLKNEADLYINAQKIKSSISNIKETSSRKGRSLNIGSVSDGQGS